jgi:hypothetical protein
MTDMYWPKAIYERSRYNGYNSVSGWSGEEPKERMTIQQVYQR